MHACNLYKHSCIIIKGGSVISPPEDLYNCPMHVPLNLWFTLRAMHNESQMWAIKYITSSSQQSIHGPTDTQLDTRISLIQGPPGTGKVL